MPDVSWGKVAYLVLSVIGSAVATYFFACVVGGSSQISQYVATILSILAASLFAVISILGDPSMLLGGNARVAWESAKDIQQDIQVFKYLFLLYIVTLGLLVFSAISNEAGIGIFYLVKYAYTFCAFFSFLVSLSLPFQFAAIQKSRLADEIDERSRRRG